MTDLAEFEFYHLIQDHQQHRDPKPLADAIRKTPEIVTENAQIREFIADLIDGTQTLPKPKGLIQKETLQRNKEIIALIALYNAMGFPIYNKTGTINCCDLIAENHTDDWYDCPTSGQYIHSDIYKKTEKFTSIKAVMNEMYGLAIHISNNRQKPKSWDDAVTMSGNFNNLSEEEQRHYLSYAQAEIEVLRGWNEALKKAGKAFKKREWLKHRDEAVKQYLKL